jgi:predicted  nucleic acid-binding Zn-ribbon protein
MDQDYEARRIQAKVEHTLNRQKEEQRRLKLEEESRRQKLQEEEEYRQRRLREEQERKEMEARQREQRRLEETKRKTEIEEVQTREATFWSLLAPEEVQRLRGMLQAVVLYQQQLAQNETTHADLHERIDAKEKAYQKFRQRVQRSSHDTDVARDLEERARDELGRWSRKREQYENPGQDIQALRRRQHSLQSELHKLQEQCEPLQVEASALREKLTLSDGKSGTLASQLVSIKSKSQQTAASLKASNVEVLAALHAQHTEEFAKIEVDLQNQLGEIRVKHAQEASNLRLALEEANWRKEKLRQERDFTADQLLEGQREGARLHGLFADARQEVLELSAQLKASGAYSSQAALSGARARSRSMSQLGKSAPASPAISHKLDSSMCSTAGGMRVDSELQMFRKRCKQLEKECHKTHTALEKKQAACDMWRRRSFEQGSGSCTSAVSEEPAPFTLGPADKDISADTCALRLLSPNGTRTL